MLYTTELGEFRINKRPNCSNKRREILTWRSESSSNIKLNSSSIYSAKLSSNSYTSIQEDPLQC
jgi:hypothetical protein